LRVVLVIDSRKKRPVPQEGQTAEATPNASLFEEKAKKKGKASSARAQNRLTVARLRELEEQKETEVLRGYRRVVELWPRILTEGQGHEEAQREWIVEAEKLVYMFRETRNLFLTSRVRFHLLKYNNYKLHFVPEAPVSWNVPQDSGKQAK
jgi:general transcription factor 3C polypeptide 3 (transcription factor C subunit 4)